MEDRRQTNNTTALFKVVKGAEKAYKEEVFPFMVENLL